MGLLEPFKNAVPLPYKTGWRSPSNIAFVKYWGKKGHQLPANPSISMTLKECYTQTSVEFLLGEKLEVLLNLEGKKQDGFGEKIEDYLRGLLKELPWLATMQVKINTRNTFPHGAGIASSASGLSAFALCLADYLHLLKGEDRGELFYRRASHLARLASGSACRSVYGGFVTWGDESEEWASKIEVHPEMAHLHDTVLVISGKEKSVSSRAGHQQMTEHAYAQARYVEAKKNFQLMVAALQSGDLETMGKVLENEALQLHAMMLASPDSFTLLRPETLTAIEMIRDFREQTGLPLYFTLDAGPNLHLIYPEALRSKIFTFISHELTPLTEKIIDDQVGEGPVPCL